MSPFWIIVAIINAIGLILCIFALKRVHIFVRSYRFEESRRTLMFNHFSLRFITTAYLIYTIFFIILTSLIISQLTDS